MVTSEKRNGVTTFLFYKERIPKMYPVFGTNQNARKKRVKYEGTNTIYEGMPLCYNYDATANILDYDKGAGGDVDSQETPSTTAEGNQNEGKFILVEDPATANLQFFAGVVAGTSYTGKVGPMWLDIYVPNGAIVPVRTDADPTVGVTVLGIADAATLCSSGGRPVAVSMETATRSGTNGVVLAKLDPAMFGVFESGVGSGLTIEGLTGGVLNKMQGIFEATSGTICGTMTHITANGAIAGSFNAWSTLNYLAVSGAVTGAGYIRAVLAQCNLAGATLNNGGLYAWALHAQLHGAVTNTEVQRVAAACFEISLSEVPDTGDCDVIFLRAACDEDVDSYVHMWGDGEKANFIWKFSGCGGSSGSALIKKMGTGGMWTNTGAWLRIPIDVEGTTYYIPAGAELSEA